MAKTLLCCLIAFMAFTTSSWASEGEPAMSFSAKEAARFAELALDCVHREYPNKIAHVMQGDEDVAPPRQLHPAFYGCFDWHSSVHGHWLLVRLLRYFPDAPFSERIETALNKSFTKENITGEIAYFDAPSRESYERPYGLAWLLQLCAELREWDDPRAKAWFAILAPLEETIENRFRAWLPKLAYPIRTGEHSQTAFAFGLALDHARTRGDHVLEKLFVEKIRNFYGSDSGCNLAFEPSGQDFLSPCLAEADLMRRIMPPEVFAAWLGRFLPDLPLIASKDWLAIGVVTDPSDGKLAHLDGLNLSRAWMLQGIAAGLPPGDPRIAALNIAAEAHARSGLASVTGEHYEGGPLVGQFCRVPGHPSWYQ